jgi:hypothetical protein
MRALLLAVVYLSVGPSVGASQDCPVGPAPSPLFVATSATALRTTFSAEHGDTARLEIRETYAADGHGRRWLAPGNSWRPHRRPVCQTRGMTQPSPSSLRCITTYFLLGRPTMMNPSRSNSDTVPA